MVIASFRQGALQIGPNRKNAPQNQEETWSNSTPFVRYRPSTRMQPGVNYAMYKGGLTRVRGQASKATPQLGRSDKRRGAPGFAAQVTLPVFLAMRASVLKRPGVA